MARRGRPAFEDVLTPAEWRVAESVRHGLSNPQIARRLGVSVDAVKFHVANVLLKLQLADRRALRRWDGVRRDSPLTEVRTMSDPSALASIGQIARTVSDVGAAEAWYRDVLGLRHLYTFGTHAFFDLGGVRLYLAQGESVTSESIIYFRVAQIHATVADLTARGVEFLGAAHLVHRHADGTEEWMAFFRDNEGRPLALMSQVAPRVADV